MKYITRRSNRRSFANFAIAIGLVWLSYMLFTIYQDERELWVLALFLVSLVPLAVSLDELINEIYVEKDRGDLIVRPSTIISITKTKRFQVKDINRLKEIESKKENVATKTCQFCYSVINIQASKCPQCTSNLE